MSARAPDTLGREEAMPPLELYEPTAELTSRPLLLDRLEQALRLASRQKHMVAVLLVELDNVRTVNRSLGYAAGDELLAQVGRRMREQVRAGDSVAQLGDDEFAILLPDVTAVGYARAASRIVGSLREPFAIDGHELPMSASIGIATSRGGGVEPATVLQNAGIAMQRAKRQGKAYELFNADMHSAAIRRLGAEAELRRAVARSEFTMHFQPIVGLEAGETVAVEALMRWEHPQHGLLEAQNFIDLAEETQLILPLGRFALRESCRRLSAWQAEDARGQSVGLFVNVSAQQLATPRFAHEVLEALRETGLEPGRLTLEMTETLMKPDADCLLAMLRRLRASRSTTSGPATPRLPTSPTCPSTWSSSPRSSPTAWAWAAAPRSWAPRSPCAGRSESRSSPRGSSAPSSSPSSASSAPTWARATCSDEPRPARSCRAPWAWRSASRLDLIPRRRVGGGGAHRA